MDGSVVMGPLTCPQWISTLSCDRCQSGGSLILPCHPGVAEEQRPEPFPANLYPTRGVHHEVQLKKSKIESSIDSVLKLITPQSASLDKDKVYVRPLLISAPSDPGGALPSRGNGFARVFC
jgi:hypothetical protein